MSGHNESVNDVTAEARGYARGMPLYARVPMTFKTFLSYLDRIEAAADRDMKRAIIKIKGLDSSPVRQSIARFVSWMPMDMRTNGIDVK